MMHLSPSFGLQEGTIPAWGLGALSISPAAAATLSSAQLMKVEWPGSAMVTTAVAWKLLVFSGLAFSDRDARAMVATGDVRINGARLTKRTILNVGQMVDISVTLGGRVSSRRFMLVNRGPHRKPRGTEVIINKSPRRKPR
jgi:ribosomal 50S subunit-recycling heat shock protein